MMATPRFRRRTYLIKRGLQLKYLGVIAVSMLLTAGLVGLLLYLEIWGAVIPEFSEAKLAEKLEVAAHLRDYEQVRRGAVEHRLLSLFREAKLLSAHEQDTVATVLRTAHARLIPKLLALLLLIGAASILVSHHIAGPIYRFEQMARAVGGGDLTLAVRLRQGDELRGLAEGLNQMVGSLRQTLTDVRAGVQALAAELDGASKVLSEHPDLSQVALHLNARLSELQRLLATFRLTA